MSKVAQSVLDAFGADVIRARALKGWQLKDLAKEMGGTSGVSFLSDIEKGKRSISSPTVGKLIKALDLDEGWIDKFLTPDDPSPPDEITNRDRRSDQLFASVTDDLGLGERYLIALAKDYAEGETTDLETAYRGLLRALETARDMKARPGRPDNLDGGMTAIRAEVQRLNEADEADAADAAIAEALEQKRAETAALLDLGVQQARIRNDPKAAAARLVERLQVDAPTDPFNALRALFIEWYEIGRDAGLAFEASIAIHLAQHSVELAKTPDERGAALNDLGAALRTLGARNSDTALLEQAVTAYRDALLERTRDRVPLDWAGTQNNLGAALQTLGERKSDTALLEQAVTAYRDALLEWTRDRVPLSWANTQYNLAVLHIALLDQSQDAKHLSTARIHAAAALEVFEEAQASHYIDLATKLIARLDTLD